MTTEPLAPWAQPVPGATGLMSPRELARLPETVPGYELVDGRLVQAMPTGGRHGRVAMLAAETGFDLSTSGQPRTVLAPDAAFVRTERMPSPDSEADEEFWLLAPDLVIEVASPDQHRAEMAAKARRWIAAGVRLLWVVWPAKREVDVWRPGAKPVSLGEGDQLDGLDVVPGFSCPMARIFS